MKFSELKLGMKFGLRSEDNFDDYTEGKIVKIKEKDNGNITVQFDDKYGVYTWGKKDEPVHYFMEFLSNE